MLLRRIVSSLRGAAGAAVHGMVRRVRAPAGRTADDVAAGPSSSTGDDRDSRRRRRGETVADRQRPARVLCRHRVTSFGTFEAI